MVTLTVGGNDLERIFAGVPVEQVLAEFAANVHGMLCGLRDGLAAQGIEATIIVGNQYDYPWLHAIVPQTRQVVMVANALLAAQAAACGAKVADAFTAFDGRAELYLHYRTGADPMEVHPTNAGYRVIAKAFVDAARE